MNSIKILQQPNDITCGPTCLHAVYNYYGEPVDIDKIIHEVGSLETGGTLSVMLANHALKQGYDATIYTYNLTVFDPTWFSGDVNISAKLKEQLKYKKSSKLRAASLEYIEFLRLGGKIKSVDLNPKLLMKFFNKGIPILTGLSATYLYNCSREFTNEEDQAVYHDTKGYNTGHFVLLSSFDKEKRMVSVSDPYKENPISGEKYYYVDIGRLLNSIMLSINTYDSNLLLITPRDKNK
ncbi:MAG: C39 family peptidase [Melioribacteraceae bacterium]|nr:C39 family peptidase [Melioribacteraceae bacterium]